MMIEGIIANDIAERIEAFVAYADAVTDAYWKKMGYTYGPAPKHRAKILSKQWAKVITQENFRDTSVYCFICLADGETKTLGVLKKGDIHKAASFKSPSRTSRGNVFQENFNNCATPHGVQYLK